MPFDAASPVNIRHRQQIVQEAREMISAREHDRDLRPLRDAEGGIALQELRLQHHAVQRVAELVGDVREELALGPFGAVGFVLGVASRRFRPIARSRPVCGQAGQADCAAGFFCVTGCCQPTPQ
jgi:hypothetical protein